MSIFTHPIKTIAGDPASLEDYKGDVLLVVNVASKCGFTPQYTGLEDLEKRFGTKGFHVLGFPCNQFGGQEPGSSDEITEFCTTNYGVSFPMFEKVDVNGAKQHPIFTELTKATDAEGQAGEVQWNFEKFLVGKDGSVIGRYRSPVLPEDEQLVATIEGALSA